MLLEAMARSTAKTLTVAKLTDLAVLLFKLLADFADWDVVTEWLGHLTHHPGGSITGRPQIIALQEGEGKSAEPPGPSRGQWSNQTNFDCTVKTCWKEFHRRVTRSLLT